MSFTVTERSKASVAMAMDCMIADRAKVKMPQRKEQHLAYIAVSEGKGAGCVSHRNPTNCKTESMTTPSKGLENVPKYNSI